MSMIVSIPIEILPHGRDLPIPEYATEDSSGFDLRAAISGPVILEHGTRFLVPCGFCMKIPKGYEAQIRSRSGLSLNHGVIVLNSPGTIDADYWGEIKVILINLGGEDYEISRGLRCAQMVICPILKAQLTPVPSLETLDGYPESNRRGNGFGSTGMV